MGRSFAVPISFCPGSLAPRKASELITGTALVLFIRLAFEFNLATECQSIDDVWKRLNGYWMTELRRLGECARNRKLQNAKNC